MLLPPAISICDICLSNDRLLSRRVLLPDIEVIKGDSLSVALCKWNKKILIYRKLKKFQTTNGVYDIYKFFMQASKHFCLHIC